MFPNLFVLYMSATNEDGCVSFEPRHLQKTRLHPPCWKSLDRPKVGPWSATTLAGRKVPTTGVTKQGCWGVGRGVGFYDHGILVNFCVGSARKGLKDVRGLAFVVGRPGRLGSVRSVTNLQLSGSETFTWIISWALAKFRNSLIPKDYCNL